MIDLAQLTAEGVRLDGTLAALPLGDGTGLRGVAWRLLVMPAGAVGRIQPEFPSC